ncbi:TPA: hypothetical protein DCZ39_05135 [Patescibacteria group bacterium]|nr:hypothetical protein [Candidatus Gracilibacteria bacterium]
MTRYTMKLDMQDKGLLPADLYATGTFAAIIDGAKYYNGMPTALTKSPPDKGETERGFEKSVKIFLFYRAYTK